METLPLPKTFKFISEEGNKSVFVLEPCYPGYGETVGNAMRRILLSSLPGAAVTAIKIKAVDHEFSTIPNVREDVVDIILNIKQLRLSSRSGEPVRLILSAKGDKKITAGMIEKNDLVEIANPDLHIATLDGKSAELEMEFIVEQGRGYVPVEAREDEKMEIGMIAVDAIYSPIRNVNFTVENVRVGKMTNYDKLTLYMTTNGTIDGREALDQAAKLAVEHFQLVMRANFEKEPEEQAVVAESFQEDEPDVKTVSAPEAENAEFSSTGGNDEITALNLSKRSYNALIKNNITSLEKFKALTEEDLKNMRGLGEKSINEIVEKLSSLK